MDLLDTAIFDRIGEEGFHRLVSAFYRRVRVDDILAPLYPQEDLEGAEQRLRDFLVFRFGGPRRYVEERGHPRLRMRHAPFAIDQRARDRWVALMDEALEEAAFDERTTVMLRSFLHQVATMMINRAQA